MWKRKMSDYYTKICGFTLNRDPNNPTVVALSQLASTTEDKIWGKHRFLSPLSHCMVLIHSSSPLVHELLEEKPLSYSFVSSEFETIPNILESP